MGNPFTKRFFCSDKSLWQYIWQISGIKGRRQGDPISAYLFILAVEFLAVKIRSETSIVGFSFNRVLENQGNIGITGGNNHTIKCSLPYRLDISPQIPQITAYFGDKKLQLFGVFIDSSALWHTDSKYIYMSILNIIATEWKMWKSFQNSNKGLFWDPPKLINA